MINIAKKELEKWNKILGIIDKFKKDAPEGFLNYQERNGKLFYYQMVQDKRNGRRKKTYIKRKDILLAKRLAQKSYYAQVEDVAEKNKAELERFIRRYDADGINEAYEMMSDVKQALILPILGSKEYALGKWKEQKGTNTASHPELRIYETHQGELVRSKSEVIIANALFQKKDELLYVYEAELALNVGVKKVIFHPDFKVLNIRTGRIVYWEHFGMLDNPYYASDFTNKINTYINSGYILGKDLFISVETSEIPLDTRSVKRIINEICQG